MKLENLLGMLAGAALYPVARQIGLDMITSVKQRSAEQLEPLQAIPVCEGCQRVRATMRCPRHKRLTCRRCICPDCKALRARLKAGTPRTPANYAPPTAQPVTWQQMAQAVAHAATGKMTGAGPTPPHDPATCRCPWCAKFDGPHSNNENVGMP